MAYRIIYQWDRENSLNKKKSEFPWITIALIALATVVIIRMLIPNSVILETLFYPFTDKAVWEAFGNMIEQLEQGASVGEAMTVFCTEVLSDGS